MDTGLGQAECHGLGTEWAVLTNEVSKVESRKYLEEGQQGSGLIQQTPWPLHDIILPGPGIPQAACKLSTGAPYLTSSDPPFPPFPPHSDWSYASFELLTAKTSMRVSKVAQQKYLQVTGESGVQSVGPNA